MVADVVAPVPAVIHPATAQLVALALLGCLTFFTNSCLLGFAGSTLGSPFPFSLVTCRSFFGGQWPVP